MAKFPDLSGDGKVTRKDILMGRGVIKGPKASKKSPTDKNRRGKIAEAMKQSQTAKKMA